VRSINGQSAMRSAHFHGAVFDPRRSHQASGGWSRTASRLKQKAQQTEASGATWLRADLLNGIFWASEWAHSPLPDKTAAMAELIKSALVDQHHLSVWSCRAARAHIWGVPTRVGPA
jgi:hypothetical protein